jgi:hypothetical protein
MSGVHLPTSVTAVSTALPAAAVGAQQTLAEAALQRQSTLLGAKGLSGAAVAAAVPTLTGAANQLAASWPTAAAPSTPAAPIPVLPQAEQTHISAQAREALGAGFDPRGAALLAAGARVGTPLPTTAGGTDGTTGAGLAGARQAVPVAAAWPAAGLDVPLRQMVQSLVQQVTAQGGAHAGPQRVIAAQVWPLSLAHALESSGDEGEGSPMQTWLVRQGMVQTAEGPRGLAMTLRVPAPWLASLASQAAPAAPATAVAAGSSGGLQVAYAGAPQNLQSAVLALVLQGNGPNAARTSALLVLDFQPMLATAGVAVYGRDLLQARHDPWVQQAQLQASGQLAKDEEIAREREREAGLCQAPGCPYALRAPCAQPFCLEMRVGTPLAGPTAMLDVVAGRTGTTGSVTRL